MRGKVLMTVMVGLLVLSFLSSSAEAAGGLSECTANLNACTTSFGTCTGNLNTCTTNFGTCADNLNACTQNSGTCADNLSTCTQNLEVCTTELTEAQTAASLPDWSKKIASTGRWLSVMDNAAVLDGQTGLVWQKQIDGTLMDHSTAVAYCAALPLGGQTGWRLPSIAELATLVDPSVGGAPYLPPGHLFTGILVGHFWSSSNVSPYAPDYAWLAHSDGGFVHIDFKPYTYYARCVRGVQ